MVTMLYSAALLVFVQCVCGLNRAEWTAAIEKNLQAHVIAYNNKDFDGLAATYTNDVHRMQPGAPAQIGLNATIEAYMQSDEAGKWVDFDKFELEYLRWFCGEGAVAELSYVVSTPSGYVGRGKAVALFIYQEKEKEAKVAINIYNRDP